MIPVFFFIEDLKGKYRKLRLQNLKGNDGRLRKWLM
jgi:hypothetical protein